MKKKINLTWNKIITTYVITDQIFIYLIFIFLFCVVWKIETKWKIRIIFHKKIDNRNSLLFLSRVIKYFAYFKKLRGMDKRKHAMEQLDENTQNASTTRDASSSRVTFQK